MKKILAALAVSLMAVSAAQAAEMADVDTDGNGTVSMEEAKAAMPDMADDAFKAADANADGQLETLCTEHSGEAHDFLHSNTEVDAHGREVSSGRYWCRLMHDANYVDVIGMTTEGDRFLKQALSVKGGKGLFIKELEQNVISHTSFTL